MTPPILESTSTSAVVDSLDKYVQHLLDFGQGPPGISISVTSKDSLLLSRHYGFADQKLKTPVTDSTLFQIGSITKSFTAIALLQLVEKGRLSLDEPVKTYLPWLDVKSQFPPITTHHLLTHSAGIPNNWGDMTSSPFMAYALMEQEVARPPGDRYEYSNIGYQVLHILLEQVSEQPFREVIQQQILNPLEMKWSNPTITLSSRATQAVGYIPPFDDREYHPSQGLIEAPHFAYGMGDACIQSTAPDMARFLRMLLRHGRGPTGPLISEDSYIQLTTPYMVTSKGPNASHQYAYGLVVRTDSLGNTTIGHNGGTIGFTARVVVDPSAGIGVAVLSNGPPYFFTDALSNLTKYARSLYHAEREQEALPHVPQPLMPKKLKNAEVFGGTYTNRSGLELNLIAVPDSVWLQTEGKKVRLEPRGADSFYVPHRSYSRYLFSFTRDDSGRISRLSHGPDIFRSEGSPPLKAKVSPSRWQAYIGKYRSYSPWFSYFEIYERENELFLWSAWEDALNELESGFFKVGAGPTLERLAFADVVDGKALRAVLSGQPFFRVSE